MERASPRAEHTSSANAITWHFNDDFNIVVHRLLPALLQQHD